VKSSTRQHCGLLHAGNISASARTVADARDSWYGAEAGWGRRGGEATTVRRERASAARWLSWLQRPAPATDTSLSLSSGCSGSASDAIMANNRFAMTTLRGGRHGSSVGASVSTLQSGGAGAPSSSCKYRATRTIATKERKASKVITERFV